MLDQLDYAADVAGGYHLPLDVWAFDRAALPLYQGVPDSHDDLKSAKISELAPIAGHPRTVTRPALLLEAWIAYRGLHPSASTYAVILSDGDSEVYTDRAEFYAALKTLGTDPNFHLAVLGINPENRRMWDEALARAMPGRYQMADEQNGMTTLQEYLKACGQ